MECHTDKARHHPAHIAQGVAQMGGKLPTRRGRLIYVPGGFFGFLGEFAHGGRRLLCAFSRLFGAVGKGFPSLPGLLFHIFELSRRLF